MTYSNAAAYERFMGRWSARLAPSFLRFVGAQDGQHVLDVGCGTGSLSRAVVISGASVKVTGIDPVAAYVSFARDAVPEPRALFQIGGADALPFPARVFDAALALLVLQDLNDPGRAVREMARVTKAGGIVATCLWDFQHGMPMFSLLWQAAEAVAPEAVARQRRHNPGPPGTGLSDLISLWESCGLEDIRTTTLELSMEFSSFDDYWQPFLGGSTPTSAFAAALDAETGGTLVNELRAKLPDVRPDGSFVLPARAWAIKGTVHSA
jgi:SAM-dependent methyltransferase